MRRPEEEKVWGSLKKSRIGVPSKPFSIGKVTLDASQPCLVIGGRNGAGKSRLLRSCAEQLDSETLYIDLHHLSEQALIVLRSRDDFIEMKEEFEPVGPRQDSRADIERIIGREYEEVEWFAFEVEPSDSKVADRFRWGGEQPLLPFFSVRYRGVYYTSRDMGLGEFSVHFLFWILDQYRDKNDLTLLLDEPDAFLPPIGVSSLLTRLLRLCLEKGWNLMFATHSAEIIGQALEEEAFALLRTDNDGETTAIPFADDPTAADGLLVRPPIRHVVYVEDESAWYLAHVLIEKMDRRVAKSITLVWGNGAGYLKELQLHVPKPPQPEIHFAFLLDGDQREDFTPLTGSKKWPALFLPTTEDPDELFKTARNDVPQLAQRLNVSSTELDQFIDGLQGKDVHDWVNDLGEEYGRTKVLRILAEQWVENNPENVNIFLSEIRKIFRFLS